MKIISHRGNLYGPDPSLENKPIHIFEVLKSGFDVEIDVWNVADHWFLGHDEPTYEISFSFLKEQGLWCHAKNIHALQGMQGSDINFFWHQEDDFTLTSKGYIWTFPDKQAVKGSVALLFQENLNIPDCYGVCVDHVYHYVERLAEKI